MRGNRSSRWVLFLGIALASLGLMGCGKKATTAMPMPGPTQPGQPGAYMGSGGGLEQNPGTPLQQTSSFLQIFQAMQQALSGNKRAVAISNISTAYAVESTYQATYFRPISQPQQEQAQGMYDVMGGGNSNYFRLVVGGDSYRFVFATNVAGVVLHSTDQVVMFQSENTPGDIMKVMWRSASPVFIRFRITQRPQYGFNSGQPDYNQFPNRGYSSVPQLMVYQQTLQVQSPYQQYQQQQQPYYGQQQQQQQYQQPYYPTQQPQQNNGGGWNQYPGQL